LLVRAEDKPRTGFVDKDNSVRALANSTHSSPACLYRCRDAGVPRRQADGARQAVHMAG
jgi:hypothetical protein